MNKELNAMKIKLSLDTSEVTEKLNRCEDQIDRILEKQQLIGVDIAGNLDRTGISILLKDGQHIDRADRDVAHSVNVLSFYMNELKTRDYGISKLVEELEFYRNKERKSNIGR